MIQLTPTQILAKKAFYGQLTTYLIFASLIVLFVYWSAIRSIGFKIWILVFQIAPLLALLPGMIKKAYRVYSWLCFISLFYFIFAVQLVFSSTRGASDFVFLALIVLLFNSAMMTSRWLQRLQKSPEEHSVHV